MAKSIKHLIARLFSEEDGATLVEYVLLVALMAMGALLGLKFFGLSVNNKLSSGSNSVVAAIS
jgi:Flp pilus assembly pilin Flp